MSAKKKNKKNVAAKARPAKDMRAAESAEAAPLDGEEAARILRARREAATGGPVIDRDIHFSLPLTKLFVPLIAAAVIAYALSVAGARFGIDALYYGGRWGCSLLFIAAVVVWFVSRSQAKKLTAAKRD